MEFTDSVDEIVALCMSLAGIAILLGGGYAIFYMGCDIAVEELLLISSALLGPSTGYLFGKAMPKQDSTIKDAIIGQVYKK